MYGRNCRLSIRSGNSGIVSAGAYLIYKVGAGSGSQSEKEGDREVCVKCSGCLPQNRCGRAEDRIEERDLMGIRSVVETAAPGTPRVRQ